jgi:ubiquinone/menaquinone biosynthesis C-methylase UbiE
MIEKVARGGQRPRRRAAVSLHEPQYGFHHSPLTNKINMKDIKDNFTLQSNKYAKYRPAYPPHLYNFLFSLVEDKQAAWDCGTGNGQVALTLSKFFDKVYATDISEQQIKNAVQQDNVFYSVERAESTLFGDNSFGLITVAQAIHWFDFDSFYKEVNRTLRHNGVLAVIGYGLVRIDNGTDQVIDNFYQNIIGPYWDKERKYIDENYQTIPFPFNEIKGPVLKNTFEWTLEEFTGYLETWSAVQHYIKAKNEDPVQLISGDLEKIWTEGTIKEVQFPILLRVAKIEKEL